MPGWLVNAAPLVNHSLTSESGGNDPGPQLRLLHCGDGATAAKLPITHFLQSTGGQLMRTAARSSGREHHAINDILLGNTVPMAVLRECQPLLSVGPEGEAVPERQRGSAMLHPPRADSAAPITRHQSQKVIALTASHAMRCRRSPARNGRFLAFTTLGLLLATTVVLKPAICSE